MATVTPAGPIASFMCGPGGSIVGLAIAFIISWSAAGLLGAKNRIKATLAGTMLAVVLPYLFSDLIVNMLADGSGSSQQGVLGLCMPRLVSVLTSAGFALVGVLAWCRFEASD